MRSFARARLPAPEARGGALSCALWGLWRRADRCCLMPRLSPVRCGCALWPSSVAVRAISVSPGREDGGGGAADRARISHSIFFSELPLSLVTTLT